MQSDPIFIIASALAVSALLASAATHKVRAPARFAKQLADYQLLPAALVRPSARLIPLLELAIAFALLVPLSRGWAALSAASLLALYAAATVTKPSNTVMSRTTGATLASSATATSTLLRSSRTGRSGCA